MKYLVFFILEYLLFAMITYCMFLNTPFRYEDKNGNEVYFTEQNHKIVIIIMSALWIIYLPKIILNSKEK